MYNDKYETIIILTKYYSNIMIIIDVCYDRPNNKKKNHCRDIINII